MRQATTTTPTALSSIDTDTPYSIQNTSESAIVLLSIGSSAPDADEPDFKLPPLEFFIAEAGSGESIYVWHAGDNAIVVGYLEAA